MSAARQKEDELAVLADFVVRPGETRRFAEEFLVSHEAFQDGVCAAAWDEMMRAESDDPVKLQRILWRNLQIGNDGKAQDAVLDLASPNVGICQVRLHDLAMREYQANVRAAVAAATASVSDCADGESFEEKVRLAVAEVPKPPKLGCSREELLEEGKQDALTELPEIPSRLLHVPGFIDDLVEYTLATAYKPNRTLAFAGALALLGHLASRKYCDRRRTRTNLFILAAIRSGCGKEWIRAVNRTVLTKCRLGPSVQDELASGEAIEEVLWKQPSTLLQLDEFQKLLERFANVRDQNAQKIEENLTKLYTKSGSVYTLRTKATAPEQAGRTVEDPSLSLFATGVAHRIYATLTPTAIEDGFVGRCLVFDSEVEGPDNTFEEDPVPIPPSVLAMTEEFANVAERQKVTNTVEPLFVPYAEQVNARIVKITAEIRARKNACDAKDDVAGVALWARAGEKVSKLALIYAVSENPTNPVITFAGVNWAWELVQELIGRMLARIENWMTNGKSDEYARKVIVYLRKNGGRASRRDVMRRLKIPDKKTMLDVEDLLVMRNDVTAHQASKNSVIYRLVQSAAKGE